MNDSSFPLPPDTHQDLISERYPGYGVSFLVDAGLRHSIRPMLAAGSLCITERMAKNIRKGHGSRRGGGEADGRGSFLCVDSNGAGMGNGIECFLNLIL